MKILSLFDGISCARVALKKAKIKVDAYYASEIDKYAIQISQKNFPDIKHLGDIKTINKKSVKKIDLLIGGSPCQDLSIAKKGRKGLKGERSSLFWEYVRILKEVKPKYFILENVASMPKEDKDIITKTLGVEPIMINAALVSAQNRKRLFWTNIKGVQQPKDKNIFLKDILENGDFDRLKSYCIDANYFKGTSLENYKNKGRRQLIFLGGVRNKDWAKNGKSFSRNFGQGDRVYSVEGKSATLSALGGGRGAKTGLYAVALRNRGNGKKPEIGGDKANAMTTVQTDSMVGFIIPEATKKGYAIAKEGQSVDLSFPKSKTRRGRVGDKVKNIMTSQNIGVVQNMQIRKLTPIECERLQCLPDGYTDGISNTQRYKTLGNAFNVDVVMHILKYIKK